MRNQKKENKKSMINRKKGGIAVIAAALLLTGSACMVTAAAGTTFATKNELNSQGAFRYQDGEETVVIDSADLYTLADTLDLFKVRVAEQLGTLHTYLSKESGTALTGTSGVYVSHKKPSAAGEIDPTALSFDALLEGIAASQSIPTDPAAYGLESGTTLYLGTDGKLYQTNGEDREPLNIYKAAEENLSAGAAAWVDGRLILGTGADNKTYQDKGAASGTGSSSGSSSGSSPGFSASVFSDFNKIGAYYAGFDGEIPFTFTPGKSLLLLFDGPLDATFDGANLPDSAWVGRWFSLYYWENNQNAKIKVKVAKATGGYNDTLHGKEW